MVAPRSGRWMWYTARAVVVGMLGVALACASQPNLAGESGIPSGRLTDVEVETGEDSTVVTLRGLDDPIYTASMHSDPRALVLDLAAVEMDTPNDLVMVYDGLVAAATPCILQRR